MFVAAVTALQEANQMQIKVLVLVGFFFACIQCDKKSFCVPLALRHDTITKQDHSTCVWICLVRAGPTPTAQRAHIHLLHFSNQTPTAQFQTLILSPPLLCAWLPKKRALKEAKFTQSRDAKPQGKRSQLEQNFPHADGKQRQHCSSSRKSDKSQTQIQ